MIETGTKSLTKAEKVGVGWANDNQNRVQQDERVVRLCEYTLKSGIQKGIEEKIGTWIGGIHRK